MKERRRIKTNTEPGSGQVPLGGGGGRWGRKLERAMDFSQDAEVRDRKTIWVGPDSFLFSLTAVHYRVSLALRIPREVHGRHAQAVPAVCVWAVLIANLFAGTLLVPPELSKDRPRDRPDPGQFQSLIQCPLQCSNRPCLAGGRAGSPTPPQNIYSGGPSGLLY